MLPIAVVDDDVAIRDLMRDVLIEEGYRPYLFDGVEGCDGSRRHPFMLIEEMRLCRSLIVVV